MTDLAADGLPRLVVGYSGGKDSSALGEMLHEAGERFMLLFTPTGNELLEVWTHIERMAARWDAPLVIPPGPSLEEAIEANGGLPSWRMRWCTRLIKIVPCIAWLATHPGHTLCVGLRADEEERVGLYGPYATYRYPLRDAGMGLAEVLAYLKARGIRIPKRTDCALCYGQRIEEWWALWKNHPEEYQRGVELEARWGHTFRSPGRDTWPAGLAELRGEFERGRKIRGLRVVQGDDEEDQPETGACRVCRL